MTARATNSHPDPVVLAAFVDGNVKSAELIRLTDHLRDCEECRLIAGEAARFQREGSLAAPYSSAWRWSAAAVAAAAVIALVVIVPRFRREDALHRLTAALPTTARD